MDDKFVATITVELPAGGNPVNNPAPRPLSAATVTCRSTRPVRGAAEFDAVEVEDMLTQLSAEVVRYVAGARGDRRKQ
jgi:hypothetical protein